MSVNGKAIAIAKEVLRSCRPEQANYFLWHKMITVRVESLSSLDQKCFNDDGTMNMEEYSKGDYFVVRPLSSPVTPEMLANLRTKLNESDMSTDYEVTLCEKK